MALYRQIAGTQSGQDGRVGYVGLFSGDLIDRYFTGLTPVDYSTPVPNTLQPSQPIVPDYDSGGSTPFQDPRYVDPNTITLDTTPLLEGPEVSPLPTIDPGIPVTPTTSVLPAVNQTAITNNILPLLALAGVVLVAIKGDDLLHEKRKIALLGGLGLLYYGMAKNKLV